MASLDNDLRTILERTITDARDEAEKAAAVIVNVLAVDQPRAFPTMNKRSAEYPQCPTGERPTTWLRRPVSRGPALSLKR